MLNWCQKVNIHLVENHYHYYKESKTTKTPPKAHQKLKAQPITIKPTHHIQIQKHHHHTTVWDQSAKDTYVTCNAQIIENESSSLQARQPYLWSLLNDGKFTNQNPKLRDLSQTKGKHKKPKKGLQIMKRKENPLKSIKKGLQIPIIQLNLITNSNLQQTKMSNTNIPFSKQKTQCFYEITTAPNINSKKQSLISSQDVVQKDSHSFSYSRSVSSRKSSLQHMYSRKSQAQSSSLVFSQLLSKDSFSYRVNSPSNSPKKQKTTLFHDLDRNTILSKQNQDGSCNSERSLKIEESFICEHETKKNFVLLRNYILEKTQQNLQIGQQINIGCIVSIKEISMNQMSEIARETQVYQMISHEKHFSQNFKYLLSLYQVQISKQSYLLIKQPFSSLLTEYVQKLKTLKEKEQAIYQIQQNIASLLTSLQKIGVYPHRLIESQDIVECFGIFKVHNGSILRQMEISKYSISQILDHLKKEISRQLNLLFP